MNSTQMCGFTWSIVDICKHPSKKECPFAFGDDTMPYTPPYGLYPANDDGNADNADDSHKVNEVDDASDADCAYEANKVHDGDDGDDDGENGDNGDNGDNGYGL